VQHACTNGEVTKQQPVRNRTDHRTGAKRTSRTSQQHKNDNHVLASRTAAAGPSAAAGSIKSVRRSDGQSDDTDCDGPEGQPARCGGGGGGDKAAKGCDDSVDNAPDSAAASATVNRRFKSANSQHHNHNIVNNIGHHNNNNNNTVNCESYSGHSTAVVTNKTKKKKKKKERGTCLSSAKARESLIINVGDGAVPSTAATNKSDRFSCFAGPRIPNR
jgi:hypothetical protein